MLATPALISQIDNADNKVEVFVGSLTCASYVNQRKSRIAGGYSM
jgi:hypothetical protein